MLPFGPPIRLSGRWAAGGLLAWSDEVPVLALGRVPEAGRPRRGRRARRALGRPDELRGPECRPAAIAALGHAQHAGSRAAAEAASRGARARAGPVQPRLHGPAAARASAGGDRHRAEW